MPENLLSRLKTHLYRAYHKDRTVGFVRAVERALRWMYGERPVPLGLLLPLSTIAARSKKINGLRINEELENHYQDLIRNWRLRAIVQEMDLTPWTLDPRTINILEEEIKRHRPKMVLEFGSGISTLCLAVLLSEVTGDSSSPLIFSIEQDEEYARKSEKLLAEHGFANQVTVIHAPLMEFDLDGDTVTSYDFDLVKAQIDGKSFDFCLIDGPFVEDYSGRYATIPALKPFFDTRARYFLDDALRHKELLIGSIWRDFTFIDVEGVIFTEKGLQTGWINP